ncbi:MAG: hypothetical protein Terrestrivirus2_8 [Terrestrivirus sp.]|uniref:Uncharacterized protein n=1 Tax=Terrestrivirus sp. TaxID=2487775 RepID=A0A3G4ZKX7_9VIRU|nr:MAG: hypothetical protein Terrestrivirus2_8 [Terrestrivirus sp.]
MDNKCVKILLDYGKNNIIERIDNETKRNIIYESIETYRVDNLIMILIGSFNYTDKIIWLDIKKKYGISQAEDIRKTMIKNNSKVIDLIDFDESDVNVEEEWIWYGIGGIYNNNREGTYQLFNYNDLPKLTNNDVFNDIKEFNDIKTFDDLEKNIDMLSQTINSPTLCYFDLNRETGVFYRDQQDCVIWALSKENNQVYVYDYGEFPYKVRYVAKSLPEFLTRIKYESRMFY